MPRSRSDSRSPIDFRRIGEAMDEVRDTRREEKAKSESFLMRLYDLKAQHPDKNWSFDAAIRHYQDNPGDQQGTFAVLLNPRVSQADIDAKLTPQVASAVEGDLRKPQAPAQQMQQPAQGAQVPPLSESDFMPSREGGGIPELPELQLPAPTPVEESTATPALESETLYSEQDRILDVIGRTDDPVEQEQLKRRYETNALKIQNAEGRKKGTLGSRISGYLGVENADSMTELSDAQLKDLLVKAAVNGDEGMLGFIEKVIKTNKDLEGDKAPAEGSKGSLELDKIKAETERIDVQIEETKARTRKLQAEEDQAEIERLNRSQKSNYDEYKGERDKASDRLNKNLQLLKKESKSGGTFFDTLSSGETPDEGLSGQYDKIKEDIAKDRALVDSLNAKIRKLLKIEDVAPPAEEEYDGNLEDILKDLK